MKENKGLDNQILAQSVQHARDALNKNTFSFAAVRIRRNNFSDCDVVGTWQGLFSGHSINLQNYKITPKATDHKVQLSMTA